MDKAFQIQKQVRDNAKTLQTYVTDLQNWEVEMKRKEAALNGEFEQDLPPVRSKIKKEKPVQVKKKPEKKIKSYDYEAWNKFDVDKACEDVDMEDIGPVSLDSKKSQQDKQEKLREEAQYEKERGNTFVKQEKWDEAIACYNRAIELIKDDAIYFANRGLCYLKKESLHQAESDCTEALRLDPTYVKALQRRATARERLGSLRAASHDLTEVLKLEPHNNAARKQFEAIKTRMGTKGSKSKSSPSTTPTLESKPITKPKVQPKIVELPNEVSPLPSPDSNWREGVGEKVTVIKPVKKPPHLRSKRPLKSIPIQEIQLGKTTVEKPPTRLKILEIEDSNAPEDSNDHGDSITQGDTNNNYSNKILENNASKGEGDIPTAIEGDKHIVAEGDKAVPVSPESVKLISDCMASEKDIKSLVPPVNSVQFMSEWKYLKGNDGARSDYLSIIKPSKIPAIFANALESDVLSEVLVVLHAHANKFSSIAGYLRALTSVKRFSALAMFLGDRDKQLLTKLLQHCKTAEKCSDEEIADLKNKYEL